MVRSLTILDYATTSIGHRDYRIYAFVHDAVNKSMNLYSSVLANQPIEMNWVKDADYTVGSFEPIDGFNIGISFNLFCLDISDGTDSYKQMFIIDRFNWSVSTTSLDNITFTTKDLPDKANNINDDARVLDKHLATYISTNGYMYFATKDKVFYTNDLDTMEFKDANLVKNITIIAGNNKLVVAVDDTNTIHITPVGDNVWNSYTLPPGRTDNNSILDVLFDDDAQYIYIVSNVGSINPQNNKATISILSYKDGLNKLVWLPDLYNDKYFEVGNADWAYLGKSADNNSVNGNKYFGALYKVNYDKAAHNYFKLDLSAREMDLLIVDTIPTTAENDPAINPVRVNIHYSLVSNLFAICLYVTGELWLRPLQGDLGWQPVTFDPPKNEIMLNYTLQTDSADKIIYIYAMLVDPNETTPTVYLAKTRLDGVTEKWTRLIPVNDLFDEVELNTLYKTRTVMQAKDVDNVDQNANEVFLFNTLNKRLLLIRVDRLSTAYNCQGFLTGNTPAKTFVVDDVTSTDAVSYSASDKDLYFYSAYILGGINGADLINSFNEDVLILQPTNNINIIVVGTTNATGKIYVAQDGMRDFVEFTLSSPNTDFTTAKLYAINFNEYASYFTLIYTDGSVFSLSYTSNLQLSQKDYKKIDSFELTNYLDAISGADMFGGKTYLEVIQNDNILEQNVTYSVVEISPKAVIPATATLKSSFYIPREDTSYSNPKLATDGGTNRLYLDYYGNLYLSRNQGSQWKRIAITSK